MITIVWESLEISLILSPTLFATLPDTPVSISSNIMTSYGDNLLNNAFKANINLEFSPPEAASLRGKNLLPLFKASINLTKSCPLCFISSLEISTLKPPLSKPNDSSSLFIAFSKLWAALCLTALNLSAFSLSVSKALFSLLSSLSLSNSNESILEIFSSISFKASKISLVLVPYLCRKSLRL